MNIQRMFTSFEKIFYQTIGLNLRSERPNNHHHHSNHRKHAFNQQSVKSYHPHHSIDALKMHHLTFTSGGHPFPVVTSPLKSDYFAHRNDDDAGPFSYSNVDKSDLYYVLPILMVIALGAFIIPVITTFFTAIITSNSVNCERRRRSSSSAKINPLNFDEHLVLNERIADLWHIFNKAFSASIVSQSDS